MNDNHVNNNLKEIVVCMLRLDCKQSSQRLVYTIQYLLLSNGFGSGTKEHHLKDSFILRVAHLTADPGGSEVRIPYRQHSFLMEFLPLIQEEHFSVTIQEKVYISWPI